MRTYLSGMPRKSPLERLFSIPYLGSKLTNIFLLPSRYCVVGIAILAACGLYYYVWIVLIPRWGGYEIVEEIEELEGGARLAKLVRKYPDQKHHDTRHSRSRSRIRSAAEQQPLLSSE